MLCKNLYMGCTNEEGQPTNEAGQIRGREGGGAGF